MAKKFIVQRNLRKGRGGSASYMKYLVFAAAGLVFLVIVTPYLLRDKNKGVSRRPVPDRGTITKELPKQAEQPANTEKAVKPLETPFPQASTAPEAIKAPEAPPAQQPAEAGTSVPQQAPAPEATSGGQAAVPENVSPAPSAESEQPSPAVIFPKKKAPSEAPAAAALKRPAKPEAKTGVRTHRAKTACLTKKARPAMPAISARTKEGYAVQVGVIYKDRGRAEIIRKELTAKGYEAVIRPAAGGPGYLVTTRPCARSKAYTLMEQMSIQGLKNTKVVETVAQPGHAE